MSITVYLKVNSIFPCLSILVCCENERLLPFHIPPVSTKLNAKSHKHTKYTTAYQCVVLCNREYSMYHMFVCSRSCMLLFINFPCAKFIWEVARAEQYACVGGWAFVCLLVPWRLNAYDSPICVMRVWLGYITVIYGW